MGFLSFDNAHEIKKLNFKEKSNLVATRQDLVKIQNALMSSEMHKESTSKYKVESLQN